jgi:prepilin-type N-terminal cleavage/methylation domain-containing protein
MRGMAHSRQHPQGYTLTELLVAVAISTIGFISLLNLQIGTIHSASSSRDQQMALSLAENVGQAMRMEALQWSSNGQAITNATFRYLKNAPAVVSEGESTAWLLAFKGTSPDSDYRVGPVGNDTVYDAGILSEIPATVNANYCVHYRLTWLIPNLLLRADIRVMWARPQANFSDYKACPVDMESKLHDVQTIVMPITVMRNVFVKQVSA